MAVGLNLFEKTVQHLRYVCQFIHKLIVSNLSEEADLKWIANCVSSSAAEVEDIGADGGDHELARGRV